MQCQHPVQINRTLERVIPTSTITMLPGVQLADVYARGVQIEFSSPSNLGQRTRLDSKMTLQGRERIKSRYRFSFQLTPLTQDLYPIPGL